MGELMRFDRTWALDDIIVRSGTGRLVEAYAAVFDSDAEIRDQHGHYIETIHRSAFDDVLRGGYDNVAAFYNHGFNLQGSPSTLASVPIGSPEDIRTDRRGLRTLTRFNQSRLADAVLEAIRNGDIKAYSFRGALLLSNPSTIARARRAGAPLPRVTRMRLGLREYGPTPSAAYKDAHIIGVRAA